jgi:hypothetical protein
MPFFLHENEIPASILDKSTVLLVPCGFCPAASFAVRERKPYISFFRRFLKTPVYEEYVQRLKTRLEATGVRVDVFTYHLPHQFVLCMWTSGRRKALAKRALKYDAVIVLGCEAAVNAVKDSLRPYDGKVIPGLCTEGLMNVIPSLSFPLTLSLRLGSLTRVLEYPPAGGQACPVDSGVRP